MSNECNPKDCPMETRILTLEEDNRCHKETHGKMYDRLGALEKNDAVQSAQFTAIMEKLDRMDIKHDKLTDKMEVMERTVAKQAQTLDELNERGKNNQARLDALEAKPGKKWDNMTGKFLGGVIGGLATLLAGGIVLLLAFASGLINIGG